MATITSTATGNWNVGGTWVGGAAPGIGDTAVIATGHTVTVPAGVTVTVGTDPADTTTAVVTIQGTGKLTNNGTLNVRGNMTQQRGTEYIGGPDSLLCIDSADGVNQYQWFPGSTGTGSATMTLSGTAGHPAIVDGSGGRGGINARVNWNQTSTNNISASYAIFRNLSANGSNHGFQHAIGTGQSETLNNVLFTNCYRGAHSLAAGDSSLSWNGVDIRNTVTATATNFPTITQGADKTTGTRSITNLTAYEGTNIKTFVVSAQGFTINGLYRHNVKLQVNGTVAPNIPSNLSLSNEFATQDVATNELTLTLSNGSQSFSDSIYLNHADNFHTMDETYSAGVAVGANTYSGNIFDGDGYVSGGPNDSVILKGAATVTRNIGINLSGVLANVYASTAAATVTRNTILGDSSKATEDSALINVAENGHSATQIGAVNSNLMVGVHVPIRQLGAFEAQSGFVLDYNASYNNGLATNLNYPVGHPHAGINSYMGVASIAAWWTPAQTFGTDNATNDIVADPQFVDSTWTVRGYFGAASVQAVGREMVTINGYDYEGNATTPTTKTAPTTLAAARAAFAPRNTLLRGSGASGVDIGAVNVIQTTVLVNVSRRLPRRNFLFRSSANKPRGQRR